MKKVNIYLVANENELNQDKKEIGNFIRDLNDKYEEFNIYFKLNTDNDEIINKEEIKNSELFFILFCKEIDDETIEKFNIAYDSFKNSKNPKISTYIKKSDDNPGKTVIDFMQKLDKEIGHYYNNYDSIDTIKLNLILKLKTLGLSLGKIETKEGKLYMANKEVMSLENIPIIFNNKDLNKLKEEANKLEEEYWKVNEKSRTNPENNEIKEELEQLIEKNKQIKESIFELEKNIIDLQSSFVKSSSEGELSKRQIYAQKCLEDGDIEAAEKALNLDDIKNEANKILELQDAKKDHLRVNVNELLQRVQTLMVDIHNKKRFEEIEATFEEIARIEKEGGLYRSATLKYMDYLLNNNKYEKAISLGKMFLAYLEAEGIEDKIEDKCLAQSILGQSYSSLEQYEEAEKFFIKNIEIAKNLGNYEKITEAYEEIAEFIYDKTKNYDKQREYYTKLVDIYTNHIKDEYKLCDSYFVLAVVYKMLDNYEKFEENLEKSIEINKTLREKENSESNIDNAFFMYYTLAMFSEEAKKYEKAFNCYMEAINLGESLLQNNPMKYAEEVNDTQIAFFSFSSLMESKKWFNREARKICKEIKKASKQYKNKADDLAGELVASITLISTYLEDNNYEKLDEELKKALKNADELTPLICQKENLNIDLKRRMFRTSACVGIYILKGKRLLDEKEYAKAIEYYEKSTKIIISSEIENAYFNTVMADAYCNMALAYEKLEKYNDAKNNYKLAIEIYKKLIKDKTEQIDEIVLETYQNLINLYEKEKNYDELIIRYSEVIKLQEEIAKQKSELYNRQLAINYNNLGYAYEKLEKYEEAEKNYKRAIEVNNDIINEKNREYIIKSLKNNYTNLYNLHKKMGKEEKVTYINNHLSIEWSVTTTKGRIELIVADKNNSPVAGSIFNLIDSYGNNLMEVKSGKDGVVDFYSVPEGVYTLEQISAPEGYEIKEQSKKVNVIPGGIVTVKFEN